MKIAIKAVYIGFFVFVITLIISYCVKIPKIIPIILGAVTLVIAYILAFVAMVKANRK